MTLNLDKIRDNHSKTQKYLIIRFFVLFLLQIFGLRILYYSQDITQSVYFNTIFLFYFPLINEYFFGLDTYSKFTNSIRFLGFIISGLLCAFCIGGYMGGVRITYNDYNIIDSIKIGFMPVTYIIRYIPYVSVIISFFDYAFSFSSADVRYNNISDKFRKYYEEHYKEFENENSINSVKDKFKETLKEQLNTTVTAKTN